MDLCRRTGIEGGEFSNCELGEERVDTEPFAPLQPMDEHVRAFEVGQDGCRIGALEHVVAELGGKAAENRRLVKKRANVVVERGENLVAQVLGDEVEVSSKLAHGPTWVVDVTKPEPGKDDRSGPAFGALDESLDLLRSELDMPSLDEQLARLGNGKGKLARPELHESTVSAEMGEPERGVSTGDHDQTS